MYKIVNNDVPSYLLDLLPNRVNETNIYSLGNNTDFVIPFSRLYSYESSFFPPTLKLWNDLDTPIRNLPTLPQFKTNIKTIREKIDYHTIFGERRHINNIFNMQSRKERKAYKNVLNCMNKERRLLVTVYYIFFLFNSIKSTSVNKVYCLSSSNYIWFSSFYFERYSFQVNVFSQFKAGIPKSN